MLYPNEKIWMYIQVLIFLKWEKKKKKKKQQKKTSLIFI